MKKIIGMLIVVLITYFTSSTYVYYNNIRSSKIPTISISLCCDTERFY